MAPYVFRSSVNRSFHGLYAIIGVNVAVYGGWQYASATNDYQLHRFMMNNFTLSNRGFFREHKYHTLVTAIFSHKDGFHILGNMFTLYFFGSEIILLLGTRQFLGLYFVGGTVSSLCQICWPYFIPRSWPSRLRFPSNSTCLGASGGVNSVVTYSILAFPSKVILLYGIIPIPAMLFGMGFIFQDLYGLYTGSSNIGNAAHLSGAAIGALLFLKNTRMRFR